MAEQRRIPSGSRPAARRRAPARRAPARRRRTPVRWIAPVLAVAAAAVVLVPQLTPALVEVTAATTAVAPAAQARVDVPARTSARAPVLLQAQGVNSLGGGLAVPQPPRPGRITIMPDAAVGRAPTYHQRPDACGGAGTNPRRMVPGVVPGAGRATLDWMSDNRPEVLGYRVQAVSQRLVAGSQPPPVVVSAAQPAGCVSVSVAVPGLTSGEPYVFWLEEQVTSASTGVTRLVQIGTTEAVVIG